MILETVFQLQGAHAGKYKAIGTVIDGSVPTHKIGVSLIWRRLDETRSKRVTHPQIISAAKEHLEMQLLRKVSA